MELSLRFARNAILNRDGTNHILIEVIPPLKAQTTRKPVLMIFVVDKSGSMDGIVDADIKFNKTIKYGERATKLDYAKNSTIKFLSLLNDDDLFGVVSFDDMAFVEQKLTAVGASLNQIVNNIRNIHTGGCTNISDALLAARKMIKDEHLKNYNCKIILLSDGEANRGVYTEDGLSSIALKCLKDGITISTLGIGVEYKASIMGAIAESGSGLFYHVEELSKLDEVFKDELDLSSIISAKNVKLSVFISGLIEISENMNNYPQSITNDKIEVLLGDIHNKRRVLFDIRNNFVDEDISFNFEVSCNELDGSRSSTSKAAVLKVVSATDELNKSETDKDVLEYVLSMVKNRTIVDVTKSHENGDKDGISENFQKSARYLEQLNFAYAIDSAVYSNILAEFNEMDDFYNSEELSESSARKMYQESSRRRRE